jgi:biofilm PGA synthesis protein PgaA
MKISDGNRRVDVAADVSRRVQASAHHLTRITLQASAERNDVIPNVPYFNPERTHAVGIRVEHDWITWRRYERSFTQRFVVTGASEWQKNYGSAAGLDLQYMHDWKLSRTWELHYGLGWGSHVYDGNREHRVFAVIGVSGVF